MESVYYWLKENRAYFLEGRVTSPTSGVVTYSQSCDVMTVTGVKGHMTVV